MSIRRPFRKSLRGASLIELIVFMIVVGVGVVGLVSVSVPLVRNSADPALRKQMMAAAETLLNEVLQQPFTYCDPDDVKAADALSTADCTGGAAASQDLDGAADLDTPVPASETRYSSAVGKQYDNVADYGGASSANGRLGADLDDATGGFALAGYTARIDIQRVGAQFGVTDAAALLVTVTVSRAGQEDFSLSGYRFRYAPRI
jgi:MSHA pilin protein MshD